MSIDIPPDYSGCDSLSLPSYSCQLANGEQRLDYTPRPQAAQSRPSSVYIKNSGELSVLLNDQEENVPIPVFGRRAVISGTVLLCQRQLDSIRKIVLKVEGELDSESSLNGTQSTKLINNSYTLWSYMTSQDPCLFQVPFSITLPSTFQDGDNSPALPPSYYVKGLQDLVVKYQLRFIVTRVRHQKLQDIWLKKQHVSIPFTYVPRTRAMRPIFTTPYFFSSVKSSPEEWHQAMTCLETRRSDIDLGPIFCHLFVPAGRIYGLKDTIKFHIQLAGPSCSLYKLFSGTYLDADSENSAIKKKSKNQKPFIHVNLLRQISVMSHRLNSSNSILGEGTIWPIPPDLSSCGREGNIDWDGEVRCRSDVTVGGFNAANVKVKDFIILTISPPTPTSPLLMDQKIVVPVRLVTDSFSDTITQMDSGTL